MSRDYRARPHAHFRSGQNCCGRATLFCGGEPISYKRSNRFLRTGAPSYWPPGIHSWFATVLTQIATTRPEWRDELQLAARPQISLDLIFQAYTVVAIKLFSRNGPCCMLGDAPRWRWPGAGNVRHGTIPSGMFRRPRTRFPFPEGGKGSQYSMGVTAKRRHVPERGR